jgi:proline dehydrogenase
LLGSHSWIRYDSSFFITFYLLKSCFCQFVGGDTATGALPLLHSLRLANKGLLSYPIEVDENKGTGGTHNSPNYSPSLAASNSDDSFTAIPPYKRIADDMLHSIDVVADFKERLILKQPIHHL